MAALLVEPRSVYTENDILRVLGSLGIVLIGLAGRAWAAGSAGLHTREASIKAPLTGGPYAHVRNPIYLASIVLGFGMVGLIGDPWLLAMHVGICVFLYGAIVPAEEAFLRERFGNEYVRYCGAVPRFWPRWRRWPESEAVRFEPRALLDQVRLALVLVGIYGGLHLAAWLRG
jgi:protein-S-isoprenylcysteine O-methyltransferase Ste14